MRIVVFAGGLGTIGGAERFLLNLVSALNADLIVPGYDKKIVSHFDSKINIISLNKQIPKNYFLATIVGKRIFENIDFKGKYDFFVSVDSASPLKIHRPHLLYFQTPPRDLYDMYEFILNSQKNPLKKIAIRVYCDMRRNSDRKFVKKYIDNIACNSENVRNRIQQAYQKDAAVIYPPVRAELYAWKPSEGYWLSVNRLHPWKRIELQIEAFRELPEKRLKVVGRIEKSPYVEKIIHAAPGNVEFLGDVTEKELRDLYARCEGHATTAINEDFGLTPLEAMASGKPVVAVREGGYPETIIDGVTGKLVAPDPKEIARAVREISIDCERYKESCISRAKLFDYSGFKEKINVLIKSIYEQNGA